MVRQSLEFTPIRKMKRNRFPYAGIVAALLILACAVAWAAFKGRGGHEDAIRPLQADFESVWSWSDAEFAGGAQRAEWTFRWDGTAGLKDAESLAADLGFNLNGKLNGGSGTVDVVASDPAYKLTLWVHSRQSQGTGSASDRGAVGGKATKPLYDIVLLLNAAEHAEKQTMADAIAKVEKNVAETGVDLRGGLTVKGTATAEGAGARIVKAASAKETEAYDDGHTSSLTYYTPRLGSRAASGAKTVNLQVAESVSTAGKTPELIVGVPLITGDYSLQDK